MAQTGIKSTKQLAWKLGLVKKRSKSSSDQAAKRLRKNFQPYAYLIIIDFESTCWEDKKYRTQEIIEFPAVLLNTGNGEIEEEFHFYVQPTESPVLSEFCKTLTGITQAQVEEGIPIMNCLKRFTNWLNKLKQTKNIVFGQPTGSRLDTTLCTFVTWSDWDLGVMLQYECRRKQLLKPAELNSWIDLRATYRKFYARKPEGLNGALKDLGINFEGREHSGLHDSRNTATLAWRMMCDGCILTVTKTLPQGGRGRLPLMSAGIGNGIVNNQKTSERPFTVLAKPEIAKETGAKPVVAGLAATAVPSTSKDTIVNQPDKTSVKTSYTGIKPPATNINFIKRPSADTTGFSKDESSLRASSTLGAVPSVTASTTSSVTYNAGPSHARPTENRPSRVHLGVGLAKVSTVKPKVIVPPAAKDSKPSSTNIVVPAQKSAESPTFNLVNSLGILKNQKDSDKYLTSGRPSLGASPMLRSDGLQRNKFHAASLGSSISNPKQPGPTNANVFTKANVTTNGGNSRTPNYNNSNSSNNKPKPVTSPDLFKIPTPPPQTRRSTETAAKSNTSAPNYNNSNPSSNKPKPVTSPDLFKIPTPPPPTRRSTETATRSNASFKVPTPPATGRDSLGNITSNSSMTWKGSGLSNRTPNYQNISRGNVSVPSDMHRTPPMCDCGRRTKRRVVQSPGANQGRAFYCCTLGRSTSAGELPTFGKKCKTGCKYFKWESSSPSLNLTNNSFFNSTRNSNSSMNSSANSSWNGSKIGNFNRSVSWNSFDRSSSSYTRNQHQSSPSEQFLGKLPSQKPGLSNNYKSPDIMNLSPPHYRSPDLLNDSISSLEEFPLLPPDAFSDPDKT